MRTREDFERALDAYRNVYHGDPGSPDAARSIAAAADLLAEEGRCFRDPKLLRDAVAQWGFLRREYPGSPLRQQAVFEQAQIERRDLHNSAAAKKLYRSFLVQYPHDLLAEQARSALSGGAQAQSPKEPQVDIVRRRGIPAKEIVAVPAAHINRVPVSTERAMPAADFRAAARDVIESPDLPATVQSVRWWSEGNTTRIAVDIGRLVPYRAYLSDDCRELTVLFFGARPGAAVAVPMEPSGSDAVLRSVHVSQLTGQQVEVTLAMVQPIAFRAFSLSDPNRVILELKPTAAPAPLLNAALHARTARRPDQQSRRAAAASARSAVLPPDASPSMDEGQSSMARVLGLRVRRIVIDAGHGGHDSGTLGPDGIEEKTVALDVALRLGRLLQQRLGADVVYTRRTDVYIPLEERTAMANRAHADLFLSIHANSSSDSTVRGVETYYLNFTASPDALKVAARENASSNRSVHELSDLVRKITLSDKIDESRQFAGDVQQSLASQLVARNPGLKNRGVRQAPFAVLIGAHMPSVLAEVSFLTNPQDEAQLSQPAYRERVAKALYEGVAQYVNGMSGIRIAKTVAPGAIAAPAE